MTEAAAAEQTEAEAPSAPTSLLSDSVPTAEESGAAPNSDGEKSAKEDAAPESEPPQYTDFKIPENIQVDTEMLDGFSALASEIGISQDDAQKIVDLYAARSTKGAEDQGAAAIARAEDWIAQAKADEEIGGNGFEANVEAARAAVKRFGTPGLIDVLEDFGLGNNPEMIRTFYRMSKLISEDSLVPSGRAGEGPRDPASVLYGTSN